MAITDLDKIIKKALEVATSKETLNKLGENLVDRIKKRTRLGNGVKENEGGSHKLPSLKPKTVTRRKQLKKAGDLTGPRATPAKSGVNRSGQMLESMDHKVSSSTIEIGLDQEGTRKATDLIKQNPDFTFMNVSKAEVAGLADILENEITKKLK